MTSLLYEQKSARNPFPPPATQHGSTRALRAQAVLDAIQSGTLRTADKTSIGRFERLHTYRDLKAHLANPAHPHARERQQSCTPECDPWKFEPYLLEDLLQARIQGHTALVHRLRGLLRAGSWKTYPRTSEAQALTDLDAFALQTLQRIEQRIHRVTANRMASEPNASDRREITDELEEERTRLAVVRNALQTHALGDALESAVRTIEDHLLTEWTTLKQLLILQHLSIDQAAVHPLSKSSYKTIQELRAVRDLLYFRRLYPHWAKRSIPDVTSTTIPVV